MDTPPENQKTTKFLYSLLLLLIFSLAVGVTWYNRQANDNVYQEHVERDNLKRQLLTVNEDDFVYGSKDAPVKIFKYSDSRCQYCRFLYPILIELVNQRPEEVALVYRHIPIYYYRGEVAEHEIADYCVSKDQNPEVVFGFLALLFNSLPVGAEVPAVERELLHKASPISPEELDGCILSRYKEEALQSQHGSGGALGVITIPHIFIVSDESIYDFVGNKSFDFYNQIIDELLNEGQ